MRVFRRIFGFIMLLAFCASVLGAEPLSEGPVRRAFTADPWTKPAGLACWAVVAFVAGWALFMGGAKK